MERALLGTLHQAPRLRKRSAAVLLCNPIGEEALRAHRLYRVLANQLERAGYCVLRFDYFATGDSAGDAGDASVERWLDDIALAAAEVQRAAGVARVALVGLRFGATLAALASHRLRPRQLVLWDPVVDGRAHLQELGVAHREFLASELPPAAMAALPAAGPAATPDEVIGMPFPPALVAEFMAIDLVAAPPEADRITIINTRSDAQADRLRTLAKDMPGASWTDIPASVAWNTDAALNNATVPMDIIQSIVACIEELSP